MIRIEPSQNRVQWTDRSGAHYVGRVLCVQGLPMVTVLPWCRAVRPDYDQGEVIL